MKHVKHLALASFSFHPPHLLFPLLFSHSFVSDSLWHHGLHAAFQASLSFTISQSMLKLMSMESVMPSNHIIFAIPFSFFSQSFPASQSFTMSWFFASGRQSIGPSASVLPMNIQGWFPLQLTGLISLHSKGLSKVFSSTTIQKLQFFGISLLYGPTLTSILEKS